MIIITDTSLINCCYRWTARDLQGGKRLENYHLEVQDGTGNIWGFHTCGYEEFYLLGYNAL
jgi:hypothetical protein